MSKIARLKKVLGYPERGKVQVKVGPKVEEMTATQSYRFDQLSKTWKAESTPVENPFEQVRYNLTEAGFRMSQNETGVLQKAAEGTLVAYVNAGGLQGCWQRESAAGETRRTSLQTLVSGYLALTAASCAELLENVATTVSVLEFLCPPDPTRADFDPRQFAALDAWGDGRKFFHLGEPLRVEREHVVVIAPLPGGG